MSKNTSSEVNECFNHRVRLDFYRLSVLLKFKPWNTNNGKQITARGSHTKTNKRCLQNSDLIQRYLEDPKMTKSCQLLFKWIYSDGFHCKSCYIIMWLVVTFMPPSNWANPILFKQKPNFLRICSSRPAASLRWAAEEATVQGSKVCTMKLCPTEGP